MKSFIFDELQIASILLNESFFIDYESNSLLFKKGNKLYLLVSIFAFLNVFEMYRMCLFIFIINIVNNREIILIF